ncbi:MAG: efflux RND transporter periplasmic adaptor subunit [Pirellulaceae bacterium]|nr:efflux RND transporter periplasmic adaptor subunit [Pirellulaceae bacterium]
MNRCSWIQLVAAAMLAGVLLTGCNGQQAAPPPSMPEVAVVTIEPEKVVLSSELPGRTAGYLVAEIRPQVNGLLLQRLFKEGSDVKAGQALYQIDPAPYEAALDNAVANQLAARKAADRARAALNASIADLARHEAILALAKTNLQRYEKLVKTQAVSAMQRDQAAADVEVADSGLRVAEAQVESNREAVGAAEAAIAQADAALETAKINLGYTKITAPISGRIGRSNITEGAIVMAYQAVPLATIQQLDPIFVDVSQSTSELNRLRRRLANGSLRENGTDKVKIVLEDGTAYPHEGSLKFRDVTVDPTTGSVILRIVVPNPDAVLLPGMFVRAIVDEGVHDRAILVPQQAVLRDPKGNPYALVVEAENKVNHRPLTTDRAIGDKWLVSSGLAPGDRVIVEGLQIAQRLPPGTPVKTVPFGAERMSAAKPDGKTRPDTQSR